MDRIKALIRVSESDRFIKPSPFPGSLGVRLAGDGVTPAGMAHSDWLRAARHRRERVSQSAGRCSAAAASSSAKPRAQCLPAALGHQTQTRD